MFIYALLKYKAFTIVIQVIVNSWHYLENLIQQWFSRGNQRAEDIVLELSTRINAQYNLATDYLSEKIYRLDLH